MLYYNKKNKKQKKNGYVMYVEGSQQKSMITDAWHLDI